MLTKEEIKKVVDYVFDNYTNYLATEIPMVLQSLYDLTIQSFKLDLNENRFENMYILFPSMPKINIRFDMNSLKIYLHPMDIVRLLNITKDEIKQKG